MRSGEAGGLEAFLGWTLGGLVSGHSGQDGDLNKRFGFCPLGQARLALRSERISVLTWAPEVMESASADTQHSGAPRPGFEPSLALQATYLLTAPAPALRTCTLGTPASLSNLSENICTALSSNL